MTDQPDTPDQGAQSNPKKTFHKCPERSIFRQTAATVTTNRDYEQKPQKNRMKVGALNDKFEGPQNARAP